PRQRAKPPQPVLRAAFPILPELSARTCHPSQPVKIPAKTLSQQPGPAPLLRHLRVPVRGCLWPASRSRLGIPAQSFTRLKRSSPVRRRRGNGRFRLPGATCERFGASVASRRFFRVPCPRLRGHVSSFHC